MIPYTYLNKTLVPAFFETLKGKTKLELSYTPEKNFSFCGYLHIQRGVCIELIQTDNMVYIVPEKHMDKPLSFIITGDVEIDLRVMEREVGKFIHPAERKFLSQDSEFDLATIQDILDAYWRDDIIVLFNEDVFNEISFLAGRHFYKIVLHENSYAHKKWTLLSRHFDGSSIELNLNLVLETDSFDELLQHLNEVLKLVEGEASDEYKVGSDIFINSPDSSD